MIGTHPEQLVRNYYELVDHGDIDALLRLFATDAVYQRPGYPVMTGRTELSDFYRNDRIIVSGRHTLRTVVHVGDTVAVHGDFDGLITSGESVRLRFADFFVIGSDGLFACRDTFFFQPAV